MAMKIPPFLKTRLVEEQINEFLDKVSEAALAFEMGFSDYLSCGPEEECAEKLRHISELERRADDLRRSIETSLYTELLIPDSRGDVLSLLEDLDYLGGVLKSTLLIVAIERPAIPKEVESDVKELIAVSVKAVESTVQAARAFFTNLTAVRDHIHKIRFFEREADRIAIGLRKNFFGSELPMERKIHLRDLVRSIERLTDEAENVGDSLSIYAIKRSL